MKSVAVFCGSSDKISPLLLEEARLLGETLAGNGFEIIYGGAHTGAMGALATGVLKSQGRVVGIYPSLELGHEKGHDGLSEMITVSTMAERKQMMFEKAEGFVVFPGGIGTLDELFELIVLRALHESSPETSLSMHKKPVILMNTLGFWDPLLEMLKIMEQQGFIYQPLDQMFTVTEDLQSVVHLLKK